MNICTHGRVQLILAQIRPSLPAKPGLHLRKAQIIVGVSKDEKVDILPAKGNQKGAHHPPNEEEPARPMRVLMWIARFHARRRALKAPAQRARRAIVTVQPHQDRLKLLGQVIRFGMVGLLLTVLVAAAYWAVAEFLHVDPMLSMTGVYLVFTGVGYILHSRVSFRDHGARDQAHIRTVRFFITNTLGFISNQFFVWLLVKHLGGPTWWPVIPIIFVTPVLTFTLNRKWVFG